LIFTIGNGSGNYFNRINWFKGLRLEVFGWVSCGSKLWRSNAKCQMPKNVKNKNHPNSWHRARYLIQCRFKWRGIKEIRQDIWFTSKVEIKGGEMWYGLFNFEMFSHFLSDSRNLCCTRRTRRSVRTSRTWSCLKDTSAVSSTASSEKKSQTETCSPGSQGQVSIDTRKINLVQATLFALNKTW
jgi:hypothetical protein